MELTMFERIQLLPLFQGLSTRQLQQIFERIKLDFCQNKERETIVVRGDRHNQLIYILSGRYSAEYVSASGKYRFLEILNAPALLEPEGIFGYNQDYLRTYKFVTDGSTFLVDKNVFKNDLIHIDVVRTNMLNMLSTRFQKVQQQIWNLKNNGSIEKRIIRFFCTHSTVMDGYKMVKVKMEDLAELLGESRTNVSKGLNSLQDQGVIQLKRMGIIMNSLEKAMASYFYE
ncbi:MAG: Crp/Fnr family transcriptional regulator [Bacteroidaceae bacterium]|nr:Crp/Fnr family transcriptional regulator [Bacteroidaceae bacterium]